MNPSFSVSDFVAVFNQTIDYAYPTVTIVGELANYRVSKGKWVYFDLKDDESSIRFFGTVFALPGPLEEGMMLRVEGSPRLHQTFGFSITFRSIVPVGEGAIKKATALLQAKLTAEGLFDSARKRSLPYPPSRIGLVTSGESAGHKDFLKVLKARWGGIEIIHVDVQVQGEPAVLQIIEAITQLNNTQALDVIVVTRGGGSADDLVAFSNEQVVRAIASSRVPTLVAIGHEIDVSLSELAADQRASTPSNAAELLVPDKDAVLLHLSSQLKQSERIIGSLITTEQELLRHKLTTARSQVQNSISNQRNQLLNKTQLLRSLDPRQVLKRGYASIINKDKPVSSVAQLHVDDLVLIRLIDGKAAARIQSTEQDM